MRMIFFLIFLSILFLSCNSENGVQKETQNRILLHKKFINRISFEGEVDNKKYCNDCDFNKYQVTIKIDNISVDKIELGYISFPPYYSISGDNKITLSVNRKLYEDIQEGVKIKKEENSNYLSMNDRDYELLNSQKYVWLPDNGNASNW